jgi:hypothetical protein
MQFFIIIEQYRTDLVTIPKDLYKTHVKTAYFYAVNKKVTNLLLLRKKCNELLVICYRILDVTAPLQLLVTTI